MKKKSWWWWWLCVGVFGAARDDETYRRARKDGFWDSDCEWAYQRLGGETGAAVTGGSGDGVVFSAAGLPEFFEREVAPAAKRVRALRRDPLWPAGTRVALFVESRLRVPRDVSECFDSVVTAPAVVPKGPLAFRVKAVKIAAMERSPFERTVYLDFDSVPCRPSFVTELMVTLGAADVALADNYRGQTDDLRREHASGCVVFRSSATTRLLLARYAAAHRLLRGTRRGRRDQPALMVALRKTVLDDGLRLAHISPSFFCRKNTSRAVSCDAGCGVAHKPARYDAAAKVFGVGFKKTGTTSLAAALRELKIGPEPSHAGLVAATKALLDRDDARPAITLAASDEARAFADAPWCMAASRGGLLEALAAAFPRAKFVLTRRDPLAWWTSTRNWLACLKPFNLRRYAGMLGASNFTKTEFLRAYRAYNSRVIDFFKPAPHRLLVLDLAQKRPFPWARLCAFVEAWGACPTDAHPNAANSYLRNEFTARHPEIAPGPDDLAKCADSLTDDDAVLLLRGEVKKKTRFSLSGEV